MNNQKTVVTAKISLLAISLSVASFSTLTSTSVMAGVEKGKASYYADKFVGRKTANGEVYRHGKMTAAHKTRPLGQKVKVCLRKRPEHCVVVRINDRGPFVKGRVIDLSKSAAKKLGIVRRGLAQVTVRNASE